MLNLDLGFWVGFVGDHGVLFVSFLFDGLVDDLYCFYVFLVASLKTLTILQGFARLLTRPCYILA